MKPWSSTKSIPMVWFHRIPSKRKKSLLIFKIFAYGSIPWTVREDLSAIRKRKSLFCAVFLKTTNLSQALFASLLNSNPKRSVNSTQEFTLGLNTLQIKWKRNFVMNTAIKKILGKSMRNLILPNIRRLKEKWQLAAEEFHQNNISWWIMSAWNEPKWEELATSSWLWSKRKSEPWCSSMPEHQNGTVALAKLSSRQWEASQLSQTWRQSFTIQTQNISTMKALS